MLSRFRWVFCQLEVLRYCFPPSVRQLLEELPETLDETYERILRDINKANRAHAHRLLQCLAVAVRPLRVAELAEVLAIDFETTSHEGTSKLNTDWRWANQQHAVLSTCSSLISMDEGTQVVQFSHFSVKEFLTSSRLADSSPDVSRFHILFEPAHTILARACLGVLLRLGERAHTTSISTFLSVNTRLNIGSTMLNSKTFHPTYEKGWDISLTPINRISLLGSVSTTLTPRPLTLRLFFTLVNSRNQTRQLPYTMRRFAGFMTWQNSSL